MKSAFADISVPLVPLDFMKGPNMTPKKWNLFYFFHICILTQKVLIRLLLYFDMSIIIKERVDINQDGPSLII